jgi:hypothetical protein
MGVRWQGEFWLLKRQPSLVIGNPCQSFVREDERFSFIRILFDKYKNRRKLQKN